MNGEWFLKQLQSLPPDRYLTIKGDGSAWLICINPDHAGGYEATGSAKINLEEGSPFLGNYFCFGCKCKMSWNAFATRMKLDKIDEHYQGLRHRQLSFKRNQAKDEQLPRATFRWPDTKDWRGVPGTIVRKLGGYVYSTNDMLQEQMLILPVSMYGEEVGTVRALMRDPYKDRRTGKKIEESYKNSPGTWVQHSFFGYDIATQFPREPLWIVEGPRDVCRALQADLRVCGLLGSKFSEHRTELIKLLNPPVVVLATDNDKAGNDVADVILDYCGDFVPIMRVKWAPGADVFDQTLSKLRSINERAQFKYCGRKIEIYGSHVSREPKNNKRTGVHKNTNAA